MDVDVEVRDLASAAELAGAAEPMIRCLARRARHRPSIVRVRLEGGVEPPSYRWQLYFSRGSPTGGSGQLPGRTLSALAVDLARAWDSDAACAKRGSDARIGVAPRMRGSALPDIWYDDAELPRGRIPVAIIEGGASEAAARAVVQCSVYESPMGMDAQAAWVFVGPDLEIVIRRREGGERSGSYRWSGDLSRLPEDLSKILAKELEPRRNCAPAP